MSHCWLGDPVKRPKFEDIIITLDDLLDENAINRNFSVNVGFRKASQSSDYADITGNSKRSDYSEYQRILDSSPPVPRRPDED